MTETACIVAEVCGQERRESERKPSPSGNGNLLHQL